MTHRTILSALLLGPVVACGPDAGAPGSDDAPPSEPWTVEAPAPDDDGETRVLVLHDMEGLTGQSDPRTFLVWHAEEYARGREYLLGDVNAVIAGLFDGGADVVHVVDGHGSGNPEPDLLLDRLDPRAEMVTRDAPFEAYVDIVEADAYDAVAVVGMHARTGSGGFASHTYTLGIGFELNDRAVTETELVALSWGRHGVPVIFASGDDRLAEDLETMPWLRYVTVKTATSASSADPFPVARTRARLRAEAAAAVQGRDGARAMRIRTPIRARLVAGEPADLSFIDGVPGVDYANGAVAFTATDFDEAYDGLTALVGVATRGYSDVTAELLSELDPGGTSARDRVFQRWFDVESGRWTPPEAPPPRPGTYYGYR